MSGGLITSRPGVAFDVESAKALVDAAEPGSELEIPAAITYPTVTTEQLEKVLFRDVLGSYTTAVGGSSERRGNVKLSAAACAAIFSTPATSSTITPSSVSARRPAATRPRPPMSAARRSTRSAAASARRPRRSTTRRAVEPRDRQARLPPLRAELHHLRLRRDGQLGRAGLHLPQQHELPHQDRHELL